MCGGGRGGGAWRNECACVRERGWAVWMCGWMSGCGCEWIR